MWFPEEFVELSRLFIYYNARARRGEVLQDTGTTLRDALKAVKKYGVCSESVWPYDIAMFDDRPSLVAYQDARQRGIKSYQRLGTKFDAMDALTNWKPVLVALVVYSCFMSLTQTQSVVPMPTDTSIEVGGHAMCLVGYNSDRKEFLAKNSFGIEWGDNGYCWIPFAYLDRYLYDWWVFDIELKPKENPRHPGWSVQE